jgi:hypothetical protein
LLPNLLPVPYAIVFHLALNCQLEILTERSKTVDNRPTLSKALTA